MLGYFIGTVMILLAIYLTIRITLDLVIFSVMKNYFLIPKKNLSAEVIKMIESGELQFAVTFSQTSKPIKNKPKFSVIRRKPEDDKIK